MVTSNKEFKRKITLLDNQNKELTKRQDFLNGINHESLVSLEKFTISPLYKLKDEAIAISALSDVHTEEPVIKSIVNNLNEYDLQRQSN
jgi:hypothetical protein